MCPAGVLLPWALILIAFFFCKTHFLSFGSVVCGGVVNAAGSPGNGAVVHEVVPIVCVLMPNPLAVTA